MKLTVTLDSASTFDYEGLKMGSFMLITLGREICLPYDGYIFHTHKKCDHTVLEGKKTGAKGPCRWVVLICRRYYNQHMLLGTSTL
jgi:hypothetical protein